MYLPTVTRRAVIGSVGLFRAVASVPSAHAQVSPSQFAYPISWRDQIPGDGFFIRHGYACENTWYLPGYWHTGEDWYALDDADSAGAKVVCASVGEVVFAGSDYPGLVVIVQHKDDLFSMYGHLEYALDVAVGDRVDVGQVLGAVLDRTDGIPSHLHFEMRTFLTTHEVNGDAPRYGFNCGYECAPGPGYWPIDDRQHPSQMGWRNPTHVIANRADLAGQFELSVPDAGPDRFAIWSSADSDGKREQIGEVSLEVGEQLGVQEIATGAENSNGTSAESYEVWGKLADGSGWISLINALTFETGSDGRPSTVELALLIDQI